MMTIYHFKNLQYKQLLNEMEKINETGLFYNKIEEAYEQLVNELMQKDCQRVEFIRGMLSVYSEILKDKSHWKTEPISYFK